MKTNIFRYTHKGIPVLEYSSDEAKRLIFVNHGIFGDKDKGMMLVGKALLRAGYHVVAIDASRHGERGEAPFSNRDRPWARFYLFDVVSETTRDLLSLYEDKYADTFETFDVLGISMGGYVAYYLSMQTTHLDTVVALISSPDFSASCHAGLLEEVAKEYPDEAKDKKLKIQAMDPALSSEEITAKRIIAFNGKFDEVISYEHTKRFKENNPAINMKFELFDTEHKINQAMVDRAVKHLQNQ